MTESDGFGGDLVTQPPHAHGEVPIARRDDGIGGHADTGLVVFVEDHCGRGGVEHFREHAREP